MAKVIVYCTLTCPFCTRALYLLGQKKVPYEIIRVDQRPELRHEMQMRSRGRYTVPQIFIADRHIGGCNELYALEFAGELDDLLGCSTA